MASDTEDCVDYSFQDKFYNADDDSIQNEENELASFEMVKVENFEEETCQQLKVEEIPAISTPAPIIPLTRPRNDMQHFGSLVVDRKLFVPFVKFDNSDADTMFIKSRKDEVLNGWRRFYDYVRQSFVDFQNGPRMVTKSANFRKEKVRVKINLFINLFIKNLHIL